VAAAMSRQREVHARVRRLLVGNVGDDETDAHPLKLLPTF
jgi:hypothetical protein